MKTFFGVLLLVCALPSDALLAQVEPMELSLIENGNLVKQYDVLIREERFSNDKELPLKYRYLTRMAVDFERQLLFCFRTGVRLVGADGRDVSDRSCAEAKAAGAKLVQRHLLVMRTSDGPVIRMFPDRVWKSNAAFASLLQLSCSPDLRVVGVTDFPESFTGRMGLDNLNQMGASSWNTLKVSTSDAGNGLVDQVMVPVEKRDSFPMHRSRWDMKKLVPTERATFHVEAGGEPRCLSQEYFTWQEIDGIQLPYEISADGYVVDRTESEPKFYREDGMTGQVHFFSVNKELDAELLKSELASDLNNVLRYADPKKLGVERLAEIQ